MHIFRTIEQTDRAKWNSLPSAGHPYHSWEFLRAMERGKSNDTQFWYLVFLDKQGDYEATAVLCAFETKLFGPRIRVAACGIPFPGGQHSFAIRALNDAKQVHEKIMDELERIATETKAHLILVKEPGETELAGTEIYQAGGYILAPSIPVHRLEIKWPTFQAYLQSLKSNYRHNVLTPLKAMGVRAPDILAFEDYDPSDPVPRWVIGGSEVCTPDEFYKMYRNVVCHAKIKTFLDETPEFFEELYSLAGFNVLAIKHRGRNLVVATLLQNGDDLTVLFVGSGDHLDNEFDAYLNLMHGEIQLAIQHGCCFIYLGQTTDETKMRRGSIPEKRYFFIRARNKLFNKLLHRFKAKLFPEPAVPKINVYR